MKIAKSLLTCWIGVLLTSCGDGSYQLAEGGITGSGISYGPITAFGSVWVGGVRYDVSDAEFIRNGKLTLAGQSDFQVGEIVSITGSVNADGVTGVASKVEFDREISGVVTSASTDGKTIKVLNQTITTDALTLFSGFSLLQQLSVGNVLEISGSRNENGELLASTIKLTEATFTEGTTAMDLEGNISAVDANNLTFKIGELTVNYGQSILNGLSDPATAEGQYIEVQTARNLQNGALLAEQIEPQQEFPSFEAGSYTKLEGRITQLDDVSRFVISGLTVLVNDNTVINDGSSSDIGLGAHLKVAGQINDAGEMTADEIVVRQSADPTSQLELKGAITTVDAVAKTVEVLGTIVRVDDSTIILSHGSEQPESISLNDLVPGDYIKVAGRKLADGQAIALRIDRNPPVVIIEAGTDNPENGNDSNDNSSGTNNGNGNGNTDDTDTTTGNTDNTDTTTGNTDNTDTTTGNTDNTDTTTENGDDTDTTVGSDASDTAAQITGTLENISRNNGTLQIGNNLVLTDFTTQYYQQQSDSIALLSPDSFFNLLTVGSSRLEVDGTPLGGNWFLATQITILQD